MNDVYKVNISFGLVVYEEKIFKFWTSQKQELSIRWPCVLSDKG
jgi:hypothetical protein